MRLPGREININRSFIAGLGTEPDSGAIVRSAVGLGHNLGLRGVAEGLQDRMAEAVLVEAGCDAAQGCLVGRPVAAGEITALLTGDRGLRPPADPPSLPERASSCAAIRLDAT